MRTPAILAPRHWFFPVPGNSPLPAIAPTASADEEPPMPFGEDTVITFTEGVATSEVTLYLAQNPASVNVTDGEISSSSPLSVVVTSAFKNKLLWEVSPDNSRTAGQVWSEFSVEITDQFGNRTTNTDVVSVTTDGRHPFVAPAATSHAAINGLATFPVTDNLIVTYSQTGAPYYSYTTVTASSRLASRIDQRFCLYDRRHPGEHFGDSGRASFTVSRSLPEYYSDRSGCF